MSSAIPARRRGGTLAVLDSYVGSIIADIIEFRAEALTREQVPQLFPFFISALARPARHLMVELKWFGDDEPKVMNAGRINAGKGKS